MRLITAVSMLVLSFCAAPYSTAQDNIIRIYQDADRSNHIESGISIERGILTALDEVDNQIAGFQIEFVPLDHRGNVLRSKQNYETFLADPAALVIFSGIHSPPLIRNRSFINESKALTIVPWAAGGPITRHPSPDNWVFRVSLDDTRAGSRIVDYALDTKMCQSPFLLLEATPWGDSNLAAMEARLIQRNTTGFSIGRFGMNLKEGGANFLLEKVAATGSDCIILVGNAIEGTSIAAAMAVAKTALQMPIISHWGVTGGKLFETLGYETYSKIDLTFIQSCFSFNSDTLNDRERTVLDRAIKLFPDVNNASDIKAPVGFIHAYDATRIMLAAIRETSLTGNVLEDRNAVRLALENLQKPVQGLVKNYAKPFSSFDKNSNPNGHEALGPESYCMGRYNRVGDIVLDDQVSR